MAQNNESFLTIFSVLFFDFIDVVVVVVVVVVVISVVFEARTRLKAFLIKERKKNPNRQINKMAASQCHLSFSPGHNRWLG